jgi:hypothetical protein
MNEQTNDKAAIAELEKTRFAVQVLLVNIEMKLRNLCGRRYPGDLVLVDDRSGSHGSSRGCEYGHVIERRDECYTVKLRSGKTISADQVDLS